MKKILLFTAALLCATSMWADYTLNKWVPYGSKTMACGKTKNDSIHYSALDNTTWKNANVAIYHNDSTFGDTITGSSPDTAKMGVFSMYEARFSTPSYARTKYTWKFKIGSHNQKHHSTVCLYYSQDEHPAGISLQYKKVDFSDNHATNAGEKYLLVPPFVKDNQEETAGWNYSEEYTKEFTFDYRYEVHADPTYCVLMLTHVIESGDNGKSGLQEISCIKTTEAITLVETVYYKIVTFNANGGTGTMDKDTIENSGKLSANIFTRDGYYFLGWATSQNGAVEYFDEATITATEDSKGPVTLYAQWQEADYAPIIFQYNYDCQRNPPYPKKNVDALISNFNYPLIGNNNYVGPWKLEYLEMYNVDHATMYYPTYSEPTIRDRARTMLVSYFGEENVPLSNKTDEFNVYAHEHLPVYRLSQWDETTSAFKVAAYGYAAVRANKDNAKGKVILFEQAGIARGCFLTDTLRYNTDNLSITFDADLTDSILTFRPASITAAPTAKLGMVYDGSEKTLINAGTAVGGTMHYSLDNADWSADLPKATNAGTYMVYYKVVGDATHADYTPADNTVTAKIGKATATYTTRPTAIPGLKYTPGKDQALVTAGKAAEGVQISYSRGNSEVWQANPSTAYQAGNYYVYYKIVGDDNHYGVGPDTLITTIYPSESPAIPSHDDYPANKISVLAYQQGANTGTQKADSLFDGNTSTKWCSIKWKTDAYSERPKDIVVWKTAESVKMVSYTLTTGNDTEEYPNRNWSSWTLYGGTFGSDEAAAAALRTETGWTIIDNQIQDSVMQAVNKTDYQFVCNNPGTYQYYRLVIHDIKYVVQGEKQDNIQQMAELTMGIEKATPPTDIEETNANANAKAVKILRDGQLFILREGKKYNAQGVEVR